MERKTITIIVVGIIISGATGFYGGHFLYTPIITEYSSIISWQNTEISQLQDQVLSLTSDLAESESDLVLLSNEHNSLNNEYGSLQSEHASLKSDHTVLQNNYAEVTESYEDLGEDYDDLVDGYTSLQSDYNGKVSQYNQLNHDYNQAVSNWETLSNDVLELYDELHSYVSLEDAIPRVINYDEIVKISDTIDSVTGRDTDSWDGYYKIHKYVRDEINYAYDVEIPLINSYSYTGTSYSPVVTGFNCEIRRNIIQTLEYTVEYEQGDCEDQAILEYCMIQYYREYIVDVHYSLYLAHVTFNDENSHVAVFMPITEGRICILDPAGQYQTGSWNYITGEDADRELLDYRDHWDDNDGIKKIILYSIDIDTGNFSVAFEGSLYETIEYISEHD